MWGQERVLLLFSGKNYCMLVDKTSEEGQIDDARERELVEGMKFRESRKGVGLERAAAVPMT